MAKESIENLIYEETERRLRIMEDPGYQFPRQATRLDAGLIALMIGSSILLIVLCMLGVIA